MEDSLDEDFDDNISYDEQLYDADLSSIKTDIPSDPWFDNEDINSSSIQRLDEEAEYINDLNLAYNKKQVESPSKENEIDLYSDLIIIEAAERRSKMKRDTELEELRRQLETLKEVDAQKNTKISELMKENTNLKKSICSLYQTVKSEIEYKDQLLAEANRKIDSLLFQKNSWKLRNDRLQADRPQSSRTSGNQTDKTQNSKSDKNQSDSSQNSRLDRNQDDRIQNCRTDRNLINETSSDNTDISDRNSHRIRRPTEHLKLNDTSYRRWQSPDSSRINNFSRRRRRSPESHRLNGAPVQKTRRITKSMQQDLVSLYKYKREKIPFLAKRNFGLLKR